MGIPTFSSLQTAHRALQASQALIDTAGNNISNANTKGYTRQRVDINSVSGSGYTQKYSVALTRAGEGAEAAGISQLRDPFLDARYRSEFADTSMFDSALSGLNELESVVDEIETEGLQYQLTNFVNQLQNLSQTPTSSDISLVVKTAAEQVTQILNLYSQQIDGLKEQQYYDLKNVVVNTDFNSIVESIAELNSQIREEQLYGKTPNELMDERNVLLDDLAGIVNIKVSTTPEWISEDLCIESLSVSLYDPSTSTMLGLVQNSMFNSLSVNYDGSDVSLALNTSFRLEGTEQIDMNDITGYITSGSVKSYVDLINGKGAYAETGENKFKGTQYYINTLDTFARTFSDTFNTLNAAADPSVPKPLFASADGSTTITAGNITISDAWRDDSTYITTTTKATSSTAGGSDNVGRMIAAMTASQTFMNPDGSDTMFTGTFNEFLTGMCGELGLDVALYSNYLATSDKVLSSLSDSREQLSGVSLDEEGVNLVAFQKSYSAAARYFTTLDEALDKLINETGLVGR